jgi:hypothetical protein
MTILLTSSCHINHFIKYQNIGYNWPAISFIPLDIMRLLEINEAFTMHLGEHLLERPW